MASLPYIRVQDHFEAGLARSEFVAERLGEPCASYQASQAFYCPSGCTGGLGLRGGGPGGGVVRVVAVEDWHVTPWHSRGATDT